MTIRSTINRSGWLCYFNGIEVPAISASVSGGVSTLPQASVTLPPDRLIRRIGAEDRVRMTIFYLDQYRHLVEGGGPQWRLLFDGDIIAFQYVNTPEGRQLSYTAVDPMEALGRVFPFFATSLFALAKGTVATDRNAVTASVNPFAITNSLFSVGLDEDGSRISRPFDIIDNILKLLTSITPPMGDQRSVISTGWFSEWNKRNRFTHRFVPSFGFEPVPGREAPLAPGKAVFPLLNAAQAESAIDALIRLGNDVASRGSMYALIQSLFQHVYYELQMNIAPPFLGVDAITRNVLDSPVTPDLDQNLQQSLQGISPTSGLGNSIAQYMTKPQSLFAVPPAFNVIWPSMIKQYSYAENYAKQPTRTYVGNPHLYNVLTGRTKSRNPLNPPLDEVAARTMTTGFPFDPVDDLLEAKKQNNDGSLNHHNFLVYPEEFFKGPVYYNHSMPAIFTYMAQSQDDDTKRLTRLYAKYEHFRTRFANRNGGLTLDFNPYILHGFPTIIIDNEETNLHTFGYVTNVTHSLGQQNMSTQVAYSYGQTLDEFFENMAEDQLEFGVGIGTDPTGEVAGPVAVFDREEAPMAPTNPLRLVESTLQRFSSAQNYYNQMFWSGAADSSTDHTAFNWFDVFGVRNEETGELEDINVGQVLANDATSNAVVDEATGRVPRFEVKRAFRNQMQDSAEAFKFSCRPVCTLDQWIDFHPAGTRNGPRSATDPQEGKGQDYWVEILDLIQGPGTEPGKDTQGIHCSVTDVDTRRNWRDRLLRFREKVYLSVHPFKA